MKKITEKLSMISTIVILLVVSTGVFAQKDMGKDKDKGHHAGEMRHHRNRGLRRGRVRHPVKSVSPRANTHAMTPKPKK